MLILKLKNKPKKYKYIIFIIKKTLFKIYFNKFK